jgi:hypothetical protein
LKSTLIINKSLLVYANNIEERMLKSAWQVPAEKTHTGDKKGFSGAYELMES